MATALRVFDRISFSGKFKNRPAQLIGPLRNHEDRISPPSLPAATWAPPVGSSEASLVSSTSQYCVSRELARTFAIVTKYLLNYMLNKNKQRNVKTKKALGERRPPPSSSYPLIVSEARSSIYRQ